MSLTTNGKRRGRPPILKRSADMTEEARPITETPEFQAALDARVDAAIAAALARFQGPAPAPPGSGDGQMIDRLAIALGRMMGQNGIGQNYVDPAIIAHRQDAARRLRDLLLELRAAKDEPSWRLIEPVHMSLGRDGYALIEPLFRDPATHRTEQTEIGSYAVPNLGMRPANAAATRVWALFTESIGHNTEADEVDLSEYTLTESGATIRKGLRLAPRQGEALDDQDGVRILRGDDPSKRKVQIFTAMAPVEMAQRGT